MLFGSGVVICMSVLGLAAQGLGLAKESAELGSFGRTVCMLAPFVWAAFAMVWILGGA